MTHTPHTALPPAYAALEAETRQAGFGMASDALVGGLLRTLAASKPRGRFLELGTGTGLATAWILDGMDAHSTLVSVDNDTACLDMARRHLGRDTRLHLVEADAEAWLAANTGAAFDFIFADTWHGKYFSLDLALAMLKPGGFYIIDDMLPQENWPEGHHAKADALEARLLAHPGLAVVSQQWASGVMVCVKTSSRA